jgi:hypothetical protein
MAIEFRCRHKEHFADRTLVTSEHAQRAVGEVETVGHHPHSLEGIHDRPVATTIHRVV